MVNSGELPNDIFNTLCEWLDVASLRKLHFVTYKSLPEHSHYILPSTIQTFIERWHGLSDGKCQHAEGRLDCGACKRWLVARQLERVKCLMSSIYGQPIERLADSELRGHGCVGHYEDLHFFNLIGYPLMVRSWLCCIYALKLHAVHGTVDNDVVS